MPVFAGGRCDAPPRGFLPERVGRRRGPGRGGGGGDFPTPAGCARPVGRSLAPKGTSSIARDAHLSVRTAGGAKTRPFSATCSRHAKVTGCHLRRLYRVTGAIVRSPLPSQDQVGMNYSGLAGTVRKRSRGARQISPCNGARAQQVPCHSARSLARRGPALPGRFACRGTVSSWPLLAKSGFTCY